MRASGSKAGLRLQARPRAPRRRHKRVAAAARLAGFLHDKLAEDKTFPLPEYVFIHGASEFEWGFFLQFGANLMFRWERETPGTEEPALTDELRWKMVREWVKTHPPTAESLTLDDLQFSPAGVKLLDTRKKSPTDASRTPDAD